MEDAPAVDPSPAESALAAWFDEHIRNSPIALDTPCLNRIAYHLGAISEILKEVSHV